MFNPKYECAYLCMILLFAVVGLCAVTEVFPLFKLTKTLESRAVVAFLFFNYLHTPLRF